MHDGITLYHERLQTAALAIVGIHFFRTPTTAIHSQLFYGNVHDKHCIKQQCNANRIQR